MTPAAGPTYEMLWDCRFCDAKKLLGLTHRHCPSCGAPQDADARYFPPESEKVAVQDHEYFGADVVCGHCREANARKAKHCGSCGAPLEGAKGVALREAGPGEAAPRAAARALPPPAPPAGKRSRWKVFAGLGCLVMVLLVAVGIVFALWTKEGALVVTGHRWKRQIAVERFGPVEDSAWCDSMPRDARSVRRERAVRSHRRVPDGEDCRTRKVDNGNGTFTEHQDCTPRYREEPVHDDKCRFTVDRWKTARTETVDGAALGDPRRWPDTALRCTGERPGCEREGTRKETYTVLLRDAEAHEHTCDLPEARWASLLVDSTWAGKLRVLGGGLDCESLRAK